MEVMACPSGKYFMGLVKEIFFNLLQLYFKLHCFAGCINGGAQIRPQHAGQPMRELTSSLEQLYRKLPQSQPENDVCERIYRDFLHGKESDRTKKLLHTKYRAVEKMNTVMNIKW